MKQEICLRLSIRSQSFPTTRKYFNVLKSIFYRDWDRFAKTEYERLAMEEEGGDDSEMIDAMEGWDSEDGAEEGGDDSKKKTAKTGQESGSN